MANPQIPNFAKLLMEPLMSVPEASLPGFLAQLERKAADRYRAWARESAELSLGLLACAAREDEIADRAEKLFPVLPEHAEAVAQALPLAQQLYYQAFEGHSLEDQLVIQAHAERQGSKAWMGLAAQTDDESVREELLALADIEVESAIHIDETLGTTSTGDL